MATELSQDAVLFYLRSSGGSAKNSDLLLHFRNFIRNHADRDRNREQFKRFVNSLATVRQEDGVSYVVLRKRFRGQVPGAGAGGGRGGGGGSVSPENTHLSPERAEKPRTPAQPREEAGPAPPGETAMKTILPAAGINNNMETSSNLKRKQPQPHQQQQQPHQQQPHQQQPHQQPQPHEQEQQQPKQQQPHQQQQQQQQPKQQPHEQEPLPQQPEQQQPRQQHQQQPQPKQQPHKQEPLPQQPEQQQPHQQHQPPQQPRQQHQQQPQPRQQHQQQPPQQQPQPHEQEQQQPKQQQPHQQQQQQQQPKQQQPHQQQQQQPQPQQQPHQQQQPKQQPHEQEPLPQQPEEQQPHQQHQHQQQQPQLHQQHQHQPPQQPRQQHQQQPRQQHQQQPRPRQQHQQQPPHPHQQQPQQQQPQPHQRQQPQPQPQPHQQHQQQPQQQQSQPHQQQPPHQQHQQQQPQPPHQPQQHQQHQQGVNISPEPRVSPAAAAPLHSSGEPPLKTPAGSAPPVRPQCTEVRQQTLGFGPPPGITPVVRHHGETRQQGAAPQALRGREGCVQPGGGAGGGGLHQEPPFHPQVAPRRFRHRPSYKSAVSQDEDEEEEEEEEVHMRQGSSGGGWPLEGPTRALSASSPCIIESPAPPSVASSSSSERNLPMIYIQDVEGGTLTPHGPGAGVEPGVELRGQWAGSGGGQAYVSPELTPIRYSRPERSTPSPDRVREVSPHHDLHQDRRSPQPSGVQLEPRPHHSQGALLSSSHSSIFSPSSDAGFSSNDWPPSGSSRGSRWNSSYEDLQALAGETGRGGLIQDVLQRAQRTQLESVTQLEDRRTTAGRLSPFHHSTEHLHDNQDSKRRVLPWHLSTGDLYDDHETAESSDGSSVSSPVRLRPAVTRRLSRQVRSRMCCSLGADLDQLLPEEGRGGGGGSDAARLNRLQLISSSLSLRHNLSSSSLSSCSTPPRSHSMADLVEGEEHRGGRRSLPALAPPSTAQQEGSSKQSLVPLEPREHDWLVKGAAGAWTDIYSLFRDDPSLLNKRDFISGFTVLHWISKHGDHRVLNTLWYGVEKVGLMFDVNARSTCGHTPLHVAAIHGHKNIMRLLVGKFDADVKLRDTAGKKPWHYLSSNTSLDVFQLLGAPARVALGADGPGRKVDSSWDQQQHRRRRHHLSTASSGERPLTSAGTIRVKRSKSIAALLKHKSMRRFHGPKSNFLF